MADWERYVRTVTQRYRGRIKVYELWNEPKFYDTPPLKDGPAFFSGSLEKMIEMTRIARRVIRQTDPAALLASPGFDGGTKWLELFLAAGGSSLIDVVAYHFYAPGSREMAERIVAVRQAMQRHGVGHLPLWNTESGFEYRDDGSEPAPGKTQPTRSVAAGLLAQTIVLGAAADLKRFHVFAWEAGSMGLVNEDNSPRVGLQAYASVVRWLNGATMGRCREPAAEVVVCEGRRAETRFAIAWSTGGARQWSLPLPSGAQNIKQESLLDADALPTPPWSGAGPMPLHIGPKPVFVQWTERRP